MKRTDLATVAFWAIVNVYYLTLIATRHAQW